MPPRMMLSVTRLVTFYLATPGGCSVPRRKRSIWTETRLSKDLKLKISEQASDVLRPIEDRRNAPTEDSRQTA